MAHLANDSRVLQLSGNALNLRKNIGAMNEHQLSLAIQAEKARARNNSASSSSAWCPNVEQFLVLRAHFGKIPDAKICQEFFKEKEASSSSASNSTASQAANLVQNVAVDQGETQAEENPTKGTKSFTDQNQGQHSGSGKKRERPHTVGSQTVQDDGNEGSDELPPVPKIRKYDTEPQAPNRNNGPVFAPEMNTTNLPNQRIPKAQNMSTNAKKTGSTSEHPFKNINKLMEEMIAEKVEELTEEKDEKLRKIHDKVKGLEGSLTKFETETKTRNQCLMDFMMLVMNANSNDLNDLVKTVNALKERIAKNDGGVNDRSSNKEGEGFSQDGPETNGFNGFEPPGSSE